jgi:diguanylate cyclase (GGDEF)-like protein
MGGMTSLFAQADRALRRLPDAVLVAIGVAVLLGLATVRVSTTWHDVPIIDYFLIPVAAVAWLTRKQVWGYAAAAFAAALTVWVAQAGAADAPLPAALVSATVRLAFYAVVVALVVAARRLVNAHTEEARVDPLTGMANTRAFREAADREIERGRRYGHPLSVLYLDVDDFKAVNDSFGHGSGDRLLQSVGHVMSCSVRATDVAARLGGDEFVVLMPETDGPAAGHVARRVRENLARVELPDGRPVHCSIGVATLVTPPADVDELIHDADALMYDAKQHGKDRIVAGQVA